jgi:hypothetical protein
MSLDFHPTFLEILARPVVAAFVESGHKQSDYWQQQTATIRVMIPGKEIAGA